MSWPDARISWAKKVDEDTFYYAVTFRAPVDKVK
jgi:hypothetical protein